MLRRSPRLTPASLAARRANALRSTGPRTEQGKAWSCLNALRHGRRARNFRTRLERTRDQEAIFLFDYVFSNLMERWKPPTEWEWNLTAREAVRAWCFLTGRMLLPRLKANGQRVAIEGCPTYRYGARLVCPADLNIKDKNGAAIHFRNPTPSRRKHAKQSWIPTVEFVDPPPRLPRAKRVRRQDRKNPVERTKTSIRTNLECAPESAAYLENPAAAPRPLTGGPSPAASGGGGNPLERTKLHSRTKLECGPESATCLETPDRGPATRRGPLARLFEKAKHLFKGRGGSLVWTERRSNNRTGPVSTGIDSGRGYPDSRASSRQA